jgi:hypothetical protein
VQSLPRGGLGVKGGFDAAGEIGSGAVKQKKAKGVRDDY